MAGRKKSGKRTGSKSSAKSDTSTPSIEGNGSDNVLVIDVSRFSEMESRLAAIEKKIAECERSERQFALAAEEARAQLAKSESENVALRAEMHEVEAVQLATMERAQAAEEMLESLKHELRVQAKDTAEDKEEDDTSLRQSSLSTRTEARANLEAIRTKPHDLASALLMDSLPLWTLALLDKAWAKGPIATWSHWALSVVRRIQEPLRPLGW